MRQIASSLVMTGDDDFGGILYRNRRECFRSLMRNGSERSQNDTGLKYPNHT